MTKSSAAATRFLSKLSFPLAAIRMLQPLVAALLVLAASSLFAQQTATGAVSPATPTYVDAVTGLLAIPGVTTGSATVTYTVDGGTAVTVTVNVTNGNAYLNLGQYAIGSHTLTVQSIEATSGQVSGQGIHPQGNPGAVPVLPPPPIHITVTDQTFGFVGWYGRYYSDLTDNNFFTSAGIAVDSKDTVYIADRATNQVVSVDVFANVTKLPVTTTVSSPVVNPNGLAVDASDNLFISDYTNARIVKYSPAGVETVLSIPGLGRPAQLALYKPGNILYIIDQDNDRVLGFNLTTNSVTGSYGEGSTRIGAIAVDLTGGLYISDAVLGFQKYGGSSAPIPIYAPITQAGGVFVDHAGNLYLGDQSTNALFRIDPQGHQTEVGDGNEPVFAGAEDSQGRIYFGNGANIRTFVPYGHIDNFFLTDNVVSGALIYSMPSGQTALTSTAAPATEFNDLIGLLACPRPSVWGSCNIPLWFKGPQPGVRVGSVTTSLSGGASITSLLYGTVEGAGPAFSPGTQTQTATGAALTSGVALDQSGNYYASDASTNQVFETPAGGTAAALSFTGLSSPGMLAVDGAGAVFVLDSGNNRIAKLDATQNQTAPVVAGASNSLSSIAAFTIDGDGQIYFAGTTGELYLYDRTGTTSQIASGLGSPVSIALDPYGDIYVLQLDGSLLRIDINGNKTTPAPSGTFASPVSLAVDSSETAYIAQTDTGTVTLLHPDGTLQTIPVPELQHASGIAIDGLGSILAADSVSNQFTFVDRTHQDFLFGDVPINTTQTFSAFFANSGSQPFTITGGLPGNNDFKQVTTPDACSTSTATTIIPAAGSCNLSYTVAPTTLGPISASSRITTTASLDFDTFSENVVASATLTLTPALDFGNVPVNTTSSKTLTLTNNSTSAVTITGSTVTGEGFQDLPGSCGATIAAGATCTLGVSFKPTVNGGAAGTYELTDSAGTQYATLTGNGTTGAPILTITPTTFAFGSAVDGSAPQTTTLTLKNTGTVTNNTLALGLTESDQTTGTHVPSFTDTTTCGTSLAVNATCTIDVTFTAHAGETSTGTITVTGDSGVTPATATVTGTGTAGPGATLSTTSFDFGSVTTGTTTPGTTFTLSNTGGTSLTVSSLTITGSGAAAFTIVPGSSNCGTSFAPNTACTFQVTFSPTAASSYAASVNVVDQAGTQTLSLSGTGVQPTATLTPNTYAFGNVQLGASPTHTFTITNTSGISLQTTFAGTSGSGFAVANGNGCASIASGASCTFDVTYTPTVAGGVSYTMNIPFTGSSLTLHLMLSATATVDTATLTPSTYNFGSTALGDTSAPHVFTLTNTSTVPITIFSAPSVGANFSVTTTCGSTLAVAASCTASVTFAPLAQGPITGTLSLLSNSGVQTAALSGTGTAMVSVTPSPYNFGNVPAGTIVSTPFTITNISNVPIRVGSNATAPFETDLTACSSQLAPGASCQMNAFFVPSPLTIASPLGVVSGTLTFASVTGIANSGITVPVTATVVPNTHPPTVTPTTYNFGSAAVGTASTAQTFTLTNPSPDAIVVGIPNAVTSTFTNQASVSGPFTVLSNNCPVELAAGASCTASVTFNPTAQGQATGTLTFNTSTGTPTAALSGTGVSTTGPDFTLFTPTNAAISVHRGSSANLVIGLGSANASAPFTDPVTFSASGLPAGATATFSPSTLTPGNGTTTTLTVFVPAVTAGNQPMFPTSPGGRETVLGISAALVVGLFGFRKKRSVRLLLCLCALGLLSGMAGCGTGNGFNLPTSTSNLVVTATSGSISHTISVTLTVQ